MANRADNRGKPLNVQRSNSASITERLALRVKGLTALFCILLLTNAVLADFHDSGRLK
jgi:hypothetical protein